MADHHSNMSIKSEEDEDDSRLPENASVFIGSYKKDDQYKLRELYELLKSWNLSELFQHFADEQIDLEVLAVIKPHHFERLLEPFNFRTHILFEHNLQHWRDSLGLPLPNYPANPSSFGPIRLSRISTSRSMSHINASQPTASQSPPNPVQERAPPTNTETNISLETILKSSIKGQMLVDLYEQKQRFEESQRTLLISIVAEYFNDKCIHLELSSTYKIEKEIIERFPSEQLEFYRTSKRGRIYNKYCNYKYSMIRVARTTIPIPKVVPNSDSTEDVQNKDLLPEEDAEQYIFSLQNGILSPEQFEKSWLACTKYRINEMRKLNSITNAFEKWPQYMLPGGYKYITMDFNYLQQNSFSLLDKWDSVSEKLLRFLNMGQSIKSQDIKSVLFNIKNTISKDCRDAGLLWCLHGYLKPTHTIVAIDDKGAKNTFKISIKDSQDAFVYVAKSLQDIETHRRNLIQQFNRVNPFIAVLGTSILNFTNIFVCIEEIKYPFDSFTTALDICYKLIVLFNLEHPDGCKQIWSFIQNCFFEVTPKTRFPKVYVLLNELNDI